MTSEFAYNCENTRLIWESPKVRWEEYIPTYNKDIYNKLREILAKNYDPLKKYKYVDYFNLIKKQYSDKGCGEDALMERCLYLENFILTTREKISTSTNFRDSSDNGKFQKFQDDLSKIEQDSNFVKEGKKKFEDLGCIKKIEQNRQEVVKKKIDLYGGLDKQRIEAYSKYQEKFRIFMGVSILLIGLTTIILYTKKA